MTIASEARNATQDVQLPIATEALVVEKAGADFELRPITLVDLRSDEVLVDMQYSGLCHTVISSAPWQALSPNKCARMSSFNKVLCQWWSFLPSSVMREQVWSRRSGQA